MNNNKKYLVAVYGSLMEGLHNHIYLEDSEFKGSFITEPEFTLVDLGSYPGLYENGNTSVNMEVYEVDDHTLAELDNLEGFNEDNPFMSMYLKTTIETPFGEAIGYIYNTPLNKQEIVKSGDWKEHLMFKKSLAQHAY